jgi:hypothetical protein
MSFTVNVPTDYKPSAPSSNDLGPIPAGTYASTLFDIKAEEVKSGPNAGKPRWNIQFKISGGQYDNRRVFSYIPMYVAGDFWKFENFFSSLGFAVEGAFKVPEINDILGKDVDVRVKVREAQGEYSESNEVSGFNKATTGATDALSAMGATEVVWAE